MKRTGIILLWCMALVFQVKAQNMRVLDFKLLENDLTAIREALRNKT